MRIARLLGALVAVGVLVTVGSTAGAGAVAITVAIDPTSGGAGTEIEVTGTCVDGGTACTGIIEITLVDATAAVIATVATETGGGPDTAYATAIVVPDTATAGTYTVRATVFNADDEVLGETAESFTVSAPAGSVPTVDLAPAPEAAAPEATTPAPVPARPRFTG